MLTETFSSGRFTTFAIKSPGACEAGPDNGGTVAAGVTGSFSGSLVGSVTGATLPVGTPTINCPPPNTTACFVTAIFGASAVFASTSFKFSYTADCGQALVLNQWQNADPSSGGNVGDIKSAPGAVTTVPCATPLGLPNTGVPNPSVPVLPLMGVLAVITLIGILAPRFVRVQRRD